jgi:type I restriction enzyme, S subunit
MSWTEACVGDLVIDARSGFASGDDLPDGVFQFRMNNVTTDGGIDLTKQRRVPANAKKLNQFALRPGDVLFNATNSPELVGKTAFFPGHDEPAVFSNHFVRLRPDGAVDGRYLARWLTLQYQLGVFRALCKQWVNQATVGRDALLALKIPIPPLPQQRRIADILDRADALRSQRRTALARLDDITQSMFLDLFHASDATSWPIKTIAALAPSKGSIRTGPFGSQLLHGEFIDHGVAVLGIDNVVQNEFQWGERRYILPSKYEQLRRYTVAPGDVLITIMGTCGRCAVVPDDVGVAINTKHLCCITLDPTICLPEFLHAYFLRHPDARRYLADHAKGAIMEGLNMGIVKAMPVRLPPLSVQLEFVARTTAISELKTRFSESLDRLHSLFLSLRQRAFRGEL